MSCNARVSVRAVSTLNLLNGAQDARSTTVGRSRGTALAAV